ncbi:MAG: hypothetical protein A4E48_00575 [Methanosaeta sp. PtaU1.Bin060]|nr:MAG: hypothetical protein A4E48_00575 [Methanosaeta sp. PtaU1.Bin060]
MSSVVKSDAMLQHEKWIAWVTEHNQKWIPGRDKPVNILPETQILVVAFAVITVIVAVALSIHL